MVLKQDIYDSLQDVIDPEMGINIVDLGLVYDVRVDEDAIEVDFTLTYPGCPLAPEIRNDIVETLRMSFGIAHVKAKIVWKPPWHPGLMSEEARISFGYPI